MQETVTAKLLVLFMILGGFGLGSLLSKFFISGEKSKGELFIINTSFGLGFMSLIYFAFSALQMLKSPFIYIMLGVTSVFILYGVFLAGKDLISTLKRARQTEKNKKYEKANKLHMFMLAIIIVGLAVTYCCALAPSISDDWDSLAYHLSVPKLFLEHGGFYYINFMSHSNFPMLQELLYMPSIFLGHPVGGKIISFWMGVFAIFTAGYTISRNFNKTGTIWAGFIIFAMPIFLWLITTAYVDVTLGLYVLLGVYFLLSYLDTGSKKDLIGCGIAAGFAASIKMTGIQFMVLFTLWVVIDSLIKNRKFNWQGALYILVPAVILCLPWYLKTLIFTGNPFYPFFYEIFGGKDWSQDLATTYAYKQSLFGIGHNIRSFIMTPWQMTLNPGKFYDQPGLFIGPVLLTVLPCLCLLIQVQNRKLLGLGAFILLQFILWFAFTHQSRYLMPMFLCSAVFIPAILYSIDNIKLTRGALIAIFILMGLFSLNNMYSLAIKGERYDVVMGKISQNEYISKYFKSYKADEYVNSLKEKNIRVGLIADTEGFYLDKPYVWADSSHNVMFNKEYKSPEEMIENLIKNKVNYVIVPFGEFGIGTRELAIGNNLMVFEAIDKGYLDQKFPEDLFTRTSAMVFKIEYENKSE